MPGGSRVLLDGLKYFTDQVQLEGAVRGFFTSVEAEERCNIHFL